MDRKKVSIVIEGFGTVRADYGCNLGEVLASKGLVSLPCGGRGLCGQCIVHVEGRVSPRTGNEVARGLKDNYRLACQVRVYGDVTVRLVRREIIKVPKHSYDLPLKSVNPIYEVVDLSSLTPSSKRVVVANTLSSTSGRALLLNDFMVCSIREDLRNVLLVDLGTTKIMYQVRGGKGELLGDGVVLNPLHPYGADIITRAAKAVEDPRTYGDMRGRLNSAVSSIISREKALLTVVAGNSVMELMFMGLPVRSLTEKPFQPVSRGPFIYFMPEIGCPVLLPPLLAGFVGGDAFSNLLAAEYVGLQKPYLIVDLGTNTEVLLAAEDGYYVGSAPAGPAFEGHITSGSSYALGGIEEVRVSGFREDGVPEFALVGEPTGLLGSGVISLVAELVRHGLVSRRGRIIKGYELVNGLKSFTVAEGPGGVRIAFTYRDLREFQKAMAAVKAGWRAVLARGNVDVGDLRYVVVCGTFGSRISPEDAVLLGLIPPVDLGKIVVAGNLILSGLKVYVFDKYSHELADEILANLVHVDLVRSEKFMELWVKSLEFDNAPES